MTKKRLSVWLLAVILICSLTVTAFAAAGTGAKLAYVTDPNGYLSASEREQLNRRAEAISSKYNFGVYIIVVEDYHPYSRYSEIYDCLISIYDQYNLGWGDDRGGASLMLSMSERDYALDYNGERGDYAFTDSGRDRLEDRILRYFRNNDWAGGFNEYLNCCEEYLEAAADGNPVGARETGKKGGLSALVALPGIIVSAITGAAVSAPMKSTGVKREANAYAVPGSLEIHQRSDVFLHRTVTRRRKENNSRSSGSTHHSSGSHSGSSGKF